MSKVFRNKCVRTTAEELDAIARVLNSQAWSGTSPIVREYENQLTHAFGSSHAIACSSGTAALHASLMALNVQVGDEVVMPPTAPIMTALPVLAMGAIPIFVDVVSNNRFGLDLASLHEAVTGRTKAIVSVPMWGYPCWNQALKTFAESRAIPIIEDAAQAHGSMTQGKYLGTMGKIGCFSTHERKLVCTGEGGFLLTDDDHLGDRLREVCIFGRQIIMRPNFQTYTGKFGATTGLNFKLSALSAAVGICQVGRLQERISVRTRNATLLRERLSTVCWLKEIPVDPLDRTNYYALVVKIDPDFASGRHVAASLANHGIISDTFDYDYQPLYRLPIFASYARHCPNAEALTEGVITLPTHEGLTQEDFDFIVSVIQRLKKQ